MLPQVLFDLCSLCFFEDLKRYGIKASCHIQAVDMKSAIIAALAALTFHHVAARATFQDLWVNGVDKIGIS